MVAWASTPEQSTVCCDQALQELVSLQSWVGSEKTRATCVKEFCNTAATVKDTVV
jgi:hypothetical protein